MERLVYSPKVWAYVKTDEGIVELTDFIVSGNVTRRMSAVSSAELTLRNPNFRFTKTVINNTVYPVFHPMDPITIIMQRLSGFPIQVFTGYLDKVPYLQLYPGTVTLQASCTLKRLLQTYFNPALQAVISLLQGLGWTLDTTSGMYYNAESGKNQIFASSLNPGQTTITDQQLKLLSKQANDGGFSKLLEAVLVAIGGWDLNHVHILPLQDTIVELVSKLFNQEKTEASAQAAEFRAFIAALIGQGNSTTVAGGGGGTSSGGPTPAGETQQNVQIVKCLADKYHIPAEFIMATITEECGWNPKEHSSCCIGWFQINCGGNFDFSNSNYRCTQGGFAGVNHVFTLGESQDLALTCDYFCQAVNQHGGPGPEGNWRAFANMIQGCGGSCYATWDSSVAHAKSILAKWGNVQCSNGAPVSTANTPTNSGTTTNPLAKTTKTVMASASRAGTTTNTAQGTSGAGNQLNIANMFPDGATPSRIDEGVDYGGVGKTIHCIADSDIISFQSGAYGPTPGNLMVLKFRDAPLSQGGCSGGQWYVAEAYTPSKTSGSFKAGDVIGTMIPSPGYPGGTIEVGWWGGGNSCGSPQVPLHDSGGPQTSAWGKDFSNLIVASGGPAGIQENAPQGGTPINNWKNVLAGKANFVGPGAGGGSGGGGSGTITSSDPLQVAKAVAFSALFQGPTLEEQAETLLLTGRKGLMNDQSLLPFIQQLSQACLREFMSLPNGDFVAFYPDYFGGLGRQPYWEIKNIEIMDGTIQLSDDPLVTHMYVVGDLIPFTQGDFYANLYNEMATTGVVTIADAINADFINGTFADSTTKTKVKGKTVDQKISMAINFLQKYGARPLKLEAPYIRAPFYETFYAYQQFCLRWSQQFQSAFTFTFMPELYPGGLVALPDHGLQFYVQEVIHSFDYTNGFGTNALLMAPSSFVDAATGPNNETVNINQGLIRAGMFSPSNH